MTTDIWLEKHRPKTLDQVYGNQHIVGCLRHFAQMKQLQNLILSGPPGVGKTSSILCIARAILGDKYSEAVKELNASDDRGIDAVRKDIKDFTQKTVYLPPGQTKIMILDEADSLTEGAQQALRMIISNSTDTRFVLSCNDSTKLINAIQSRCVLLKFRKLTGDQVYANLQHIVSVEGVRISAEAMQLLIMIGEGDMRQAINNLQACYQSVKKQQDTMIDKEVVTNVCDVPNTDKIKEIFKEVLAKNTNSAVKILHTLFQEGHSSYDILNIMYKVLLGMEKDMSKLNFLKYIKEMGEVKRRVLEGLSTELQLAAFLAKCSDIDYQI